MRCEKPALLTRTSRPAKAETASPIIAFTSAARETSARTKRAEPPSAAIADATRRPFSSFTSETTTRPPSCAKRIAIASPKPEPAPVTTTLFPWNLMSTSCELDGHAFQLRVVVKRLQSLLPAVAALLVAAERGLDAARHPLVDVDLSRVEAGRDTVRARQVAGPDAGGEPVVGVVGDADRPLLLVVERNHAGDRAEELLARDPHVVADARVDGGRDEPALAQLGALRERAARDRHGPFRAGDLVVLLHLLVLCARGHRSDHRVVAGAEPDRGKGLRHGPGQLVVDRPLDHDARAGEADLPRIHHEGA